MDDVRTAQPRGFIEGTGHPNTTTNPALTPVSVVYYDNTPVTGGFYQLVLVSGVKTWVPLGGPAAQASWPKYVVSNQTTPLAIYTTCQAAVNAAVADGHTSQANPAVILIHPGVYAENVTLPNDGLGLVGFNSGATLGVVINGNITATGVSSGAFNFAGIVVNGTVTVQGDLAIAAFTHVVVQASGTARGIHCTAINASLLLEGFCIVNHEQGPSIEKTGGGTIFANDLSCFGNDTFPALIFDGGQAFVFQSVLVLGQIILNDFELFASGCLFAAAGSSFLDISATSRARLIGCRVNSAPDPQVTGAGLFTMQGSEVNDSFGGNFVVASTLNTSATLAVTQHSSSTSTYVGATLAYPRDVDTLYVDTAGFVPADVDLPPLDSVMDGFDYTVKSTNGGGSLQINGNGFLIDGAATQITATPYGSFTVRADRNGGQWRRVVQI